LPKKPPAPQWGPPPPSEKSRVVTAPLGGPPRDKTPKGVKKRASPFGAKNLLKYFTRAQKGPWATKSPMEKTPPAKKDWTPRKGAPKVREKKFGTQFSQSCPPIVKEPSN